MLWMGHPQYFTHQLLPRARVQIKTQMQAHKGTSTPRIATTVGNIYGGAGILGFWRGWQPNVARCFIGNACEIGCYDEAKTRLIAAGVPDGPLGHFGASGVAGTVSAIFSTPVDVVKTRLMAQAGGVATDGVVQYTGVIDCFIRMPQLEGIGSLYKGFVSSALHARTRPSPTPRRHAHSGRPTAALDGASPSSTL